MPTCFKLPRSSWRMSGEIRITDVAGWFHARPENAISASCQAPKLHKERRVRRSNKQVTAPTARSGPFFARGMFERRISSGPVLDHALLMSVVYSWWRFEPVRRLVQPPARSTPAPLDCASAPDLPAHRCTGVGAQQHLDAVPAQSATCGAATPALNRVDTHA